MDNKNISVLIVEDNLGDFILIEDFLIDQFKNIEIIHCEDSQSATALLAKKENNFSIILLDLNLPDDYGIKLINKFLNSCSNIPIIVLTGYADLNIAKESIELGVYDFLIKDEINPTLLSKSILYSLYRKNFIQNLEEEKDNYENLFSLSPQPMWILNNDDFNIINVNQSAIEKYGYSFDESIKKSFLELHPISEREDLVNHLNGNDDSRTNGHQFTHITKDENQIKVELSFKKINSNSRKGIIVQSTDISAIINHINTIEIQNTVLKNIAWTQSHVVRAPLSRILGIINLIEEYDGNPDDLTFWLKQLKTSSQEMDEIVKKIVNEAQNLNLDNDDE